MPNPIMCSPAVQEARVAQHTLVVSLMVFLCAPALPAPHLAPSQTTAFDVEKAGVKPEADEKTKPADNPFDPIIKGAEKHEGLFTLYRVKRDLFVEIRPDQLDTPFLFLVSRGSGLGERGIYFGDPVKDALVLFRRVDDQVQLVEPNPRFRAPVGSALERSVRRSFADSVLAVFKVEATHPKRKSLLINLSSYLLTDIAGTARALNQPGQPGGFSLDAAKSYWGKVQAFPQNLELDAVGVISSDQPHSLRNVPDTRGFQVTTHYSLVQLSPSDYRPRLPDPRIGFNIHSFRDYSNLERGTRFTRSIPRWNLKQREPSARLSPPTRPIIFYLENNIPPEYRPAVREGLLMWNPAFERLGIRGAIEVREQPDDAEWDSNDFRYNTVRWVSSTDAGYGIGYSRQHPITGEVVRANITIHADWVLGRAAEYDELTSPLASILASQPARDDLLHRCDLGLRAEPQLAFGAAALDLHDAPLADRKKYLYQAIRWMTAHEMGHVLGLGHNFHGSTMLPLRDLHNTAITRARGLSGSVMDYLPPNIAPPGTPQGDYFTPTLGPYDYWAIEYAYTPIDAATPEEELPALRRIAARAAAPELAFGEDIDADSAPTGADPLSAAWDLSSDPIAWAEQRMRLCRDLLLRLETRVPPVGQSYTETRRKFDRIVGAYLETLRPVARYVGGIYTSRIFRGEPGAGLPLKPVPPTEQRRALNVIKSYLFDPGAFQFSPSLLNMLAPDPYAPWSGSDYGERVSGAADYPLREQVRIAQKEVLARLTHPVLLSRLTNSEMLVANPADAMTLPELFGWLTRSIWSEVVGAGMRKPIPAMRRSLQREHLNTLIGLMLQPAPGTPEDARSLAWTDLIALRVRLLASRKSPAAAADAYTGAHLAESAARIARALDARMTVPAR